MMLRKLLALTALLLVVASPAEAVGKQHYASTGFIIHNTVDSSEQQKIVVYGNQSDFTLDTQAIFNYETDEGPCDAASVYVSTIILWWRQHAGDNWTIISRTDPSVWQPTQGDTCNAVDRFMSSPFVGYRCGQFQAEAIFRIGWGQPHGNTSAFLTKDSDVFQLCG